MLSAGHRVIYDITLIRGPGPKMADIAAAANIYSEGETQYTFESSAIVKKYEKIWILRRVSLWQRVDDRLKYDKGSPFFQQRGFII